MKTKRMNFEVPLMMHTEMEALCKERQISKTRLFRDSVALYSMIYNLKKSRHGVIDLKTILL